jgi:hypothetical protein
MRDDDEEEDDRLRDDVYDPHTGTVRLCDRLCTTCVFRPGNLMHLAPGRLKGMLGDAIADEGHITCHSTLGTDEPAICAGFAEHPEGSARSLALRFIRAGVLKIKLITPPSLKEWFSTDIDRKKT